MVHFVGELTGHNWNLKRNLKDCAESSHDSDIAGPDEGNTTHTSEELLLLLVDFFEVSILIVGLTVHVGVRALMPEHSRDHESHDQGLQPRCNHLLRISQQELGVTNENLDELGNEAGCTILSKVLEICVDNVVSLSSFKELLLNSWSQMRLIAFRNRFESMLREASGR